MIYKIASFLSRYPSIKRSTKYLYQYFQYLLNIPGSVSQFSGKLEKISGEEGGFFGYYDKSPESPSGEFISYQTLPGEDGYSSIILYNTITQERNLIGSTKAFNYQAGCRLQWLTQNELVYNTYDDKTNRYQSIVYNAGNRSSKITSRPVYDCNINFFITIDFVNLFECQTSYGYDAHTKFGNRSIAVIKKGNWLNDEISVLLSEDEMRKITPESFHGSKNHHFNHVMISPSGNSFIYIFRWWGNKGSREILGHFNLKTGKNTIINVEMTSHCCWIDDNTVAGYLTHNNKTGYYKVNITRQEFDLITEMAHLRDGHPTYLNDKILTDTYPDNSRMQHLFVLKGHSLRNIGSFYSPVIYDEKLRCDLHPRYSRDGKSVYFDSMHDGVRNFYRLHPDNL